VHTFPSLQSPFVSQVVASAFVQLPEVQVSTVNGLPSLQFADVVQQPGVGA
jgi:hypothetical protein